MNVLILDTAAETGGAITVLEEFYNEALVDESNYYTFFTGIYTLKETKNVRCHSYAWTKKNWLFRLFFDYFVLPILVKKGSYDLILSLQNTRVPFVKCEQYIYIHNVLPFSEYKFEFKENKKMWIYQNVIGAIIKNSARKADKIIVQEEWIKEEISSTINIDKSKIVVKEFKVTMPSDVHYKKAKENLYFYPASAEVFKNHKVIIDAFCKLNNKNYKIIFTLHGDENQHIVDLYNSVKREELPVEFVGYLSKEEMIMYYRTSTLIFPSYIETIGLPLLEAKEIGAPIISANLKYAKSVLNDYEDVIYFNPFDSEELLNIIRNQLNNFKDDTKA